MIQIEIISITFQETVSTCSYAILLQLKLLFNCKYFAVTFFPFYIGKERENQNKNDNMKKH